MQINGSEFIKDTLFFIKDTLSGAISDPLGNTRNTSSGNFIMTSYPQEYVDYPIITLKMTNFNFTRAGMQTNAMDGTFEMETRVWARDEKEKDQLSTDVFTHLQSLQFVSGSGTSDSRLNNFNQTSAVEVDEDGNQGIKSRVMGYSYNFYTI